MDTILFSWIHLSDIHFGHGDSGHRHDQKLVLGVLCKDIRERVEPKHVDAIFVTGDVAFRGDAGEYALARTWLGSIAGAAGVDASSVFVVPGNHDVNRGIDESDRSVKRMVASLRSGEEGLDDVLDNAGDRGRLASRMAAYLTFAADFAPACLEAPPAARLFWSRQVRARGGLTVRVVGLNTALLAARETDALGDRGRLRLGNAQLAEALQPSIADVGELVVVMSHHPLRGGWLGDQANADAWIRNHTHVHLSGHVHEAESEEARSGAGGSFVRVVAGAAHGEQEKGVPAAHGYSFGAVVADASGKLTLKVWPRLWSPGNTDFVLDVHHVPKGRDHAEHELRARVPALRDASEHLGQVEGNAVAFMPPMAPPTAAQPIVPQPVAARPSHSTVSVFLSYAPEDEALRQKLEKHLTVMKRTGVIESFGTRSLGAGASWKGNVDERLRTAQIVLLLMSDDYLASEYCYDVEMDAARRRHEAGEAIVMAVLLRPTDLYDRYRNEDFKHRTPAWFEELARTPSSGLAVTKWSDEDEAFTQIAKDLRAAIASLHARSQAGRSS